ncbi:MAG: hypothetical protein R2911_09525 [Caldilineaceae bacterium]
MNSPTSSIFKVISYRDPAEVVDDEYPVWLTTGRRLQTYTHADRPRPGHRILCARRSAGSPSGQCDRLGLQDSGWSHHEQPPRLDPAASVKA